MSGGEEMYLHGEGSVDQTLWAQVIFWGGVAWERHAVPAAEVMCGPDTDRCLDMDCLWEAAHGRQPKDGTRFRTEKPLKSSTRFHYTHSAYNELAHETSLIFRSSKGDRKLNCMLAPGIKAFAHPGNAKRPGGGAWPGR